MVVKTEQLPMNYQFIDFSLPSVCFNIKVAAIAVFLILLLRPLRIALSSPVNYL